MLEPRADPATLVVGIDGCRHGWVAASADALDLSDARLTALARFDDLFQVFPRGLAVVAVDIPIGLVNSGRRKADSDARRLLGRRAPSVFTPPERPLLEFASLNGHLSKPYPASYSRSYEAVNEWSWEFMNHGVPGQTFGIFARIAEVDRYVLTRRDSRVYEAHPELVFREMNRGVPVAPKKSEDGAAARLRLLDDHLGMDAAILSLRDQRPAGCRLDDRLDALALLWTASRILSGQAERIPADPESDPLGLDMAMWY